MPPNPANIQTQQTLPIYTTPPPQPRSATHHRHPFTNNLIRGTPPLHTDPPTNNGHPNHSSIFYTPNLEPQTSPASSIITTGPRTEIQGHANVPTPSSLDEITPQYTESNARPRKHTAHGNISRTDLHQTQHSLAKTVEGPPPSPQTEAPRSQHYSQRVSNQTKRNHNSIISTSPIPLPQTTAITCLSDPAPTSQLATLSQDQQAKHAWQTQDTLHGTRKRTRSQTESQQHTPLTQIIDTVALNSQIVIQPTEQPTNSQPNKRTTSSQITSQNHHATQAFTQIITINIINPITYQVHNNPTFEISDHPAPSPQRRPQRKRRCEVLNIFLA